MEDDTMDVTIKAIHFDATAKLQEFVEKKVNRLEKLSENITGAEVSLKVVKPETASNKEAAVKLMVKQRDDLFASKVADTFEEAVDLCCDALKRQIEKLRKDKI